MWPEHCCAPYFKYHPSQRSLEPRGEVATEDLNLEELPKLGLEVTCFCQGSAWSSEENVKVPSPKPPIEELQKWVTWKACVYETPSWWQELTMVPGVDDHEKLACKVWASFQLPRRVIKLHLVKNNHQALPAPLCLCQKNFLQPPDSIFACQDIQEMQCEKMVAYAQALQFWVEKVNLPTGGQPCLLVGRVIELQEEMKYYLSFSDEDVFWGMVLLEETPIIPPKEVMPQGTQPAPASIPVKKATMESTAKKRLPNQFPG